MVAAWRDESLRQRIEDLLDSTFNVFKGTLEEIQKSVDELKTKLGIPNGQKKEEITGTIDGSSTRYIKQHLSRT
ncbi:hypothetical protein K4K55_006622 [Colletotrichum sp. SAR 10_96]|nr:hypothetical protein K4K55_006622 [Colletotrichum sp. SAR 10_96]